MNSLTFTLPTLPPSANNMYINNPKTGGRFIRKSAKQWKEQAILKIKNAVQHSEWEIKPKTPLRVQVILNHPYVLKWDVAGREKALMDSLADAIGVDDRYIMQLEMIKREGPEEVCVMVQAIPQAY